MSRLLFRKDVLILAAAMLMADLAQAELVGVPASPPNFTWEETVIIQRNATLSSAVKADPWTVRRLFDAVERQAGPSVQSVQPPNDDKPPPASHEELDPASDPDLPRLQRASPEAVNDLFQLLKLAGVKRQEKQK